MDNAGTALENNRDRLTAGLVSGATAAAEALAGLALILLTLFFFVKDGDRIWSWVVSLTPPAPRTGSGQETTRADSSAVRC